MKVQDWFARHHRVACLVLLVLAALNLWAFSRVFLEHPYLALANAVMAIALIAFVILSW